MDELGTPAPEAEIIEANPETETDEVVETLLSDEETAGEETPKDEPPQPRKLKVKIDGQELEVDEEEAARGYQRQADYSRNMQRVQAEMQQAQKMREAYQERLDAFIPDQVSKLQRLQAELNQLAVEDPAAWVQKQQEFNTEVQRYQMAEAERQQLNQQRQQEQEAYRTQNLQMAQQALLEAVPEWKDAAKREAETKEVTAYMTEKLGLPQEVLHAIHLGDYGHYPVVMARKAMLYDNLMQKVAARKSSKSENTQAPAPVTPMRTTGGQVNKDPSQMDAKEFAAWRRKQISARGR